MAGGSKKEYLVSVVIPIYDVEDYLRESIDSVISQTIGFEDNIQLILVNDGSPDNSGDICLEYQEKYPNNILYIKQENAGVSKARNKGIKLAQGKYISLIDSDDKINAEYYEEAIKFLNREKEVPFVASRVKWFDSKSGYHISDYKFNKTRIIDLEIDGHMIQSLVGSVVFRAGAVKGIAFDTEMTHNEDAKFIDTVLLRWGSYKYGVVREAVYMYRKRKGESSASDTAMNRKTFYSSTMKYADFLSNTREYTGGDKPIPKFIQFHALYHYRWRITQSKKPDILSEDEWTEYKNSIKNAIKSIDSDVILKGSINLNIRQKMVLMYVKFENDTELIKKDINAHSEIKDNLVQNISFSVNTINYLNDKGLIIEGATPFCDPTVFGLSINFTLDDKILKHEVFDSPSLIFDERISGMVGYRVAVPSNKTGVFKINISSDDYQRVLDIAYDITARISMRQNDYRIIKSSILLLPSINSIQITDYKIRKIIKREILFFLQNLLRNKYNIENNFIKTIVVELVRIVALVSIRIKPSGVWLFSDRSISGGDNSEVLFRYVSDNAKNSGIKPYFAINKDTKSYQALKSNGYKVVPFKSVRHLYLSIISEVILPSHLDMMYLYPWFGVWRKYCGLIQYDIVHTQHGIVLNDLSGYISKKNKNASVFLSACKWEQERLVSGRYGYTEEQVPVTGLPRYDELVDTSSESKIISIHPTWRSWLAGEPKDGKRAKSRSFNDSEYYNFYQNLINDERLLSVIENHGYKIKYYIHPNHIANKDDFSSNSDNVEIVEFPYDYSRIFSESRLFVTDYSNTLFDFAYLRKPVIHTQFDFNEFFSKHGSLSGKLFDYELDGFGPVCYDYDSTVDSLVSFVENDGLESKLYKKRVERFFTFNDSNNSQRSYEAAFKHFKENRIRNRD